MKTRPFNVTEKERNALRDFISSTCKLFKYDENGKMIYNKVNQIEISLSLDEFESVSRLYAKLRRLNFTEKCDCIYDDTQCCGSFSPRRTSRFVDQVFRPKCNRPSGHKGDHSFCNGPFHRERRWRNRGELNIQVNTTEKGEGVK